MPGRSSAPPPLTCTDTARSRTTRHNYTPVIGLCYSAFGITEPTDRVFVRLAPAAGLAGRRCWSTAAGGDHRRGTSSWSHRRRPARGQQSSTHWEARAPGCQHDRHGQNLHSGPAQGAHRRIVPLTGLGLSHAHRREAAGISQSLVPLADLRRCAAERSLQRRVKRPWTPAPGVHPMGGHPEGKTSGRISDLALTVAPEPKRCRNLAKVCHRAACPRPTRGARLEATPRHSLSAPRPYN